MENLKQIGTRIKAIRTEANYSVEKMASALGITEKEYISCENGSVEAPFSFFYKFAEFSFKTLKKFPKTIFSPTSFPYFL